MSCLDSDDVELTVSCRAQGCFMGKIQPRSYEEADCPSCKGTGRLPTTFGERVLEFLREYKDWEVK